MNRIDIPDQIEDRRRRGQVRRAQQQDPRSRDATPVRGRHHLERGHRQAVATAIQDRAEGLRHKETVRGGFPRNSKEEN